MNTGWSSFRTCGWDGAALIGGIRAIDWWLSMGIAVQMLSVVPVLGSSWISRSRAIRLTAAIFCLLTLINLLWPPSLVPAWIGLCNRFFAVVVIWVTAILCMRRVQEKHSLCVAYAGIEQQIEARRAALARANAVAYLEKGISPQALVTRLGELVGLDLSGSDPTREKFHQNQHEGGNP